MTAIKIIGPGRAGVGLGRAFLRAGFEVSLFGRHAQKVPAPLVLTWGDAPDGLGDVSVIVIAVPDDSIAAVARALACAGSIKHNHFIIFFKTHHV